MLPAGYMYKDVAPNPEWLKCNNVRDIYSVSGCISEDFCDWIQHWKHNGYWLFDSLKIIDEIARDESIDLSGMKPFFYRFHPCQWYSESNIWIPFSPDPTFTTEVQEPERCRLEGFDVVTYSAQNSAECSPLSCNHYAENLPVNVHCLFETLDEAKSTVERGTFVEGEPGPHRIIEVNSV